MKMQRIDKILSNMGIGSRKDVKKMCKQGQVEVDGEIVKSNDSLVDVDKSEIKVCGEIIEYKEFIYIMMNKPQGVLSATEDNYAETAIDLLDEDLQFFEPAPAGRLDKDTEGFLLLTNDGTMIHRIITPKKHVGKTYFARIEGKVDEQDIRRFSKGIQLEDNTMTLPGELVILSSDDISEIELTIYEGKYHQVKRMFHALGKEVIYLKRLSIGGLVLDDKLALGEYKELTAEEMEQIFIEKE